MKKITHLFRSVTQLNSPDFDSRDEFKSMDEFKSQEVATKQIIIIGKYDAIDKELLLTNIPWDDLRFQIRAFFPTIEEVKQGESGALRRKIEYSKNSYPIHAIVVTKEFIEFVRDYGTTFQGLLHAPVVYIDKDKITKQDIYEVKDEIEQYWQDCRRSYENAPLF